MWIRIGVPILGALGKVSDYFAIDKVKVTWYKILVPIAVFAAAVLFFFVIQLVLQVAFKIFRKMKGGRNEQGRP